MYPHQVLMNEQGLERNNLSPEAQGYLTDFNHQYRGIDMKRARAEKAGKEFVLSPEDDAKLRRLSKSVCIQIYEDMNTTAKELKKEKEREEALKRETEEKLRLQELEQKKIEEEQKKSQPEVQPEKPQEESGGNIFDYFF